VPVVTSLCCDGRIVVGIVFTVLLLLIFFVSLLLSLSFSVFFPDDAAAMSDVRPVDDAAAIMSCSKGVKEEDEYRW
jgi:Na+-transporting methylmalonyl-CoA/oxaloacetate decarboxylase gamma subunit